MLVLLQLLAAPPVRAREDLIRRDRAAYAEVYASLLKHAASFPPVEKLLAVTRTGQAHKGMAAVDQGNGSGGSLWIIEAVDRFKFCRSSFINC